MKLQPVHLRINDQESGKPTPCRIRVTDPSGNEFAPFGRSLNFSTGRGEDVGGHVMLGKERWFSIDGACEIAVPTGELRIQARKGLNLLFLDEVVTLAPGKMALRFNLAVDAHQSIDCRCHDMSPHDAALDAAAEGLTAVNVLVQPTQYLGTNGNTYDRVSHLASFSGQVPALEARGVQVFVNTHNRHPVLGSLGLLHSHRAVYPLNFGPPDETDDWSLRDWAGQCHRKGGFVVWTDPFSPRHAHAGEALALAILGEIDAYEITPDNAATAIRRWYQLLSAGINLPLVGSSGRRANDRPLGAMRLLPWGINVNWMDAVKSGQSTVTNEPMLDLTVRDLPNLHASATSTMPFSKIEILVNGQVADSRDSMTCIEGTPSAVSVVHSKVTGPAWVASRIIDTRKTSLDNTTGVFAHSSAHWIGEPRAKPQAVGFLLEHLRRARDWVDTEGRFDDPKSKVKLLDTFAEAMAKLERMPTA